jgi:hypothetical protein
VASARTFFCSAAEGDGNGFTSVGGGEHCADTGLYVGYVPDFPGAHSQAETLDELNGNLREVIEMLREEGETDA